MISFNDAVAAPPVPAAASLAGVGIVHHPATATGGFGQKSLQQNVIIANAGLSYEDVLNDDFQFDMDGHDVMVFLHIQKTGGTSFGRHLVRDLDLKVS